MKLGPFYIVILVLLHASCRKDTLEDCFSKQGPDANLTRMLSEKYFEIELNDRFDVVLVQDSTKGNRIEMAGPADILAGIVTEVKNNRLIVKDDNYCKWFRQLGKRIPLTIYFSDLHYLHVKGNASVKSRDMIRSGQLIIDQFSTQHIRISIDAGTFDLNHRSRGEVYVEGYSAVFVPSLFNTGGLYASGLSGDYIFVYHYGTGAAKVNPFKVLESHIENKGSVYYYTDPSEKLRKYGKGEGRVIRVAS
jgi:hypothetical protein